MSASIRAWLSLVRPPNFLTLPGDVLAGYLLAAGAFGIATGQLILALLASLCLYASGLLWNDWTDAAIDRLERPDRPIPSGQVRRGAVLVLVVLVMAAGLGLGFAAGRETGTVGALLALAVLNYNFLTKGIPLIGPLNMGVCRGLHVLLGATVVAPIDDLPLLALWGAGVIAVYVTAVTNLAAKEMAPAYRWPERWFPVAALAIGFFVYLPFSPVVYWHGQAGFALCMLWAILVCGRVAGCLPRPLHEGGTQLAGAPVPPTIGKLLGLLPVVQAAMIFGAGDGRAVLICAAAVLVLSPVQRLLSRVFYAS